MNWRIIRLTIFFILFLTLVIVAFFFAITAHKRVAAMPANDVAFFSYLSNHNISYHVDGILQQPFSPVPVAFIELYGDDIQLLNFSSPEQARQFVKKMSRDGSNVNGVNVSWLEDNAWYASGSIVILDIGNNSQISELFYTLFGAPVAGTYARVGKICEKNKDCFQSEECVHLIAKNNSRSQEKYCVLTNI